MHAASGNLEATQPSASTTGGGAQSQDQSLAPNDGCSTEANAIEQESQAAEIADLGHAS